MALYCYPFLIFDFVLKWAECIFVIILLEAQSFQPVIADLSLFLHPFIFNIFHLMHNILIIPCQQTQSCYQLTLIFRKKGNLKILMYDF